MEQRSAKVNFSAPGGTASGNAVTCKVTLPTKWVKQLGLDTDHRNVELLFDGSRILLLPTLTGEEFVKQKRRLNHLVYRLDYFNQEKRCTTLYADFTDQQVTAENHTDDPVKCAFGTNTSPNWEDFQAFLRERCLPRERAGLREYLDALGLAEYDPWEIVRITKGRMAEDQQWLRIEVCP